MVDVRSERCTPEVIILRVPFWAPICVSAEASREADAVHRFFGKRRRPIRTPYIQRSRPDYAMLHQNGMRLSDTTVVKRTEKLLLQATPNTLGRLLRLAPTMCQQDD